MSLAQLPGHGRPRIHRQARLHFCHPQAHWCSRQTIRIWTSRQDQHLGKDQEVQKEATGVTLSLLQLSILSKPHRRADRPLARQQHVTFATAALYPTKHISRDGL